MGSQALDFQFQGDVIGGASLLFSATGRLLKALNNDGVDFYAVAASIQLGKMLPLTQEREAAISQLLEQRRTSRESYLSKALRIGWGHTTVPHELARTKAGVSALNIMGVFATGCKPFESAKALSSLMEMYGCEAESLPSLDSLSTMIDCLSPFVTNSTFDAVIANIKLACIRVLKNKCLKVPNALDTRGDSTQWARIAKHLMATSSALEQAHLALGQRGAWLSAFAAHVLGMSVTIYFTDIVLWESAGINGSATLYLYDDLSMSHLLTQSLSADIQLEWLEYSTSSQHDNAMLLLSQLFESGIAWVTTAYLTNQTYPSTFDEIMTDHIREAIHRYSEHLFNNVRLSFNDDEFFSWPINGHSTLRKEPLQAALQHLGVLRLSRACSTIRSDDQSKDSSPETDAAILAHVRATHIYGAHVRVIQAISHLHHETALRISKVCERRDHPWNPRKLCLCCRSAVFIFEVSALAVALAQCSYDEKTIRINENVLRERSPLYPTAARWLTNSRRPSSSSVYFDSLFAYLVRALDRRELERTDQFDGYDLAWSEGGIVIYNCALFDSYFVDNYGHVLSITSGQISCNGLRRNLVVDTGSFKHGRRRDYQIEGTFNTFHVGTEIIPSFAQGPITYSTIIEVESATVRVEIQVFNKAQNGDCNQKLTVGFIQCMTHMLAYCKKIGQICHHTSQGSYVVRQAHSPVLVHTFGDVHRTLNLRATQTLVFAVAGSPLSQMLQVFLLYRSGYQVALQRDSCLYCIITEVRKSPEQMAVLMS